MTPMMAQYYKIKEEHKDALVFFRLGDFYEMFGDDALEGSKILGITLTARAKGENRIPMCGIPYHASVNYIAKLTKAGKKVAICEQLTDPKVGVKIVERGVVRIITPGTTLDDNILDQKTSNYIGALQTHEGKFAFSFADVSTGEFQVFITTSFSELRDELEKLRPAEILVMKEFLQTIEGVNLQKHFARTYFFEFRSEKVAKDILLEHFGVMEKVEFASLEANTTAILLDYLQLTQKTSLKHMKSLEIHEISDFMALDEASIKNLELLQSARENKVEGSLLGVLDKTVTSSGGRLLKRVIVQPLRTLEAIETRLKLVEFFLQQQNFLLDVRDALKQVGDVERIISRVSLGSGNSRDLKGLQSSFQAILQVKNLMTGSAFGLLTSMAGRIDPLTDLVSLLESAIVDEPPHGTKDGGMIRDGFDAVLDEYKLISRDGKSFIQALQERESARTGIGSLKVRYNKVFGYYIEISNANLREVPEDYTRKQTLANAERFSTPELKEYEAKVLGAEEKIYEIELQIFEKLRIAALEKLSVIQQTAKEIAMVDLMSTFALVSWENKYVKPEMHEGFELEVEGGRHPVIEKINATDFFVPNDLRMNSQESLILITGPNMGGKSTFLRQTALIVLMAHLGIFVPARAAKVALADRIFTRVGASDNLVRGQSTFWVEMEETAFILQKATAKSLIILDEIGRGTSTYDGVSIAWAIMEFLHEDIRAKTLFASHYHELIALAESLASAKNYSVKVEENERDGVVFLYKILPGGVDKSYGIEVGKLAGLPGKVIARAKEILQDLERENHGTAKEVFERGMKNLEQENYRLAEEIRHLKLENQAAGCDIQPGLFAMPEREAGTLAEGEGNGRPPRSAGGKRELSHSLACHPLLQELQGVDFNALTPIQALIKLQEFQQKSLDINITE